MQKEDKMFLIVVFGVLVAVIVSWLGHSHSQKAPYFSTMQCFVEGDTVDYFPSSANSTTSVAEMQKECEDDQKIVAAKIKQERKDHIAWCNYEIANHFQLEEVDYTNCMQVLSK